MSGAGLIRALDRSIAAILAVGRFLALPIAVLLFLQWPLRDLLRAYSREANDVGQWVFALYVAMAVTAATRAKTHLATDVVACRYSLHSRDLLWRLGVVFGLSPWAFFVLVASKPIVASSIVGLEAFPDTANPGYFLVKVAVWLLAGLMLGQSVVDAFGRRGERQ